MLSQESVQEISNKVVECHKRFLLIKRIFHNTYSYIEDQDWQKVRLFIERKARHNQCFWEVEIGFDCELSGAYERQQSFNGNIPCFTFEKVKNVEKVSVLHKNRHLT